MSYTECYNCEDNSNYTPEFEYVRHYLDGGYGLYVVFLSICIQPAIIEELTFRGIFLTTLERKFSTFDSIMISAVLFVLVHFAFGSLIHLLLIGILTGYLRVASGSLIPCIILHFFHNFYTLLYEIFFTETNLIQ